MPPSFKEKKNGKQKLNSLSLTKKFGLPFFWNPTPYPHFLVVVWDRMLWVPDARRQRHISEFCSINVLEIISIMMEGQHIPTNVLIGWNCVFYFSAVFFFRRSGWVGWKFFQEQKSQLYSNLLGKNEHWQTKLGKAYSIFLIFFQDICHKKEWVACKLFLGKKYICIFFFPENVKKKILETQLSEQWWVS